MDNVSAILKKYPFPKTPWAYQEREVNKLTLTAVDRSAYYWNVGAGKTFASTMHNLIARDQNGCTTIQTCPPVLLRQWSNWLTDCGVRHAVWYGQPKKRRQINLLDPDLEYILTTSGLIKNDFDYFAEMHAKRRIRMSVDEATCVKNFESGNYRAVLQLSNGQGVLPLTGSPLATPRDAYAYIKLVSPGVYYSYEQFERIHVSKYDFHDRPIEWRRLDLMAKNLALHASFIDTCEVHPDMPRANIYPVPYDLEKGHKKLYDQVVENQLAVLENGAVIDATTASKLWHTIQQLVINYGYFAQDNDLRPAAYDLLDDLMIELRGQKLVVYANYKMTVANLVSYLRSKGYVVSQINGAVSQKEKDAAKDSFITPCANGGAQVIVMNPQSGGVGVDGLQNVCSHMIFMELPTISKDFFQAVGRLERPGQRFITDCRVATALGTIQVHMRKQMVENSGLINTVVPTIQDLRNQLLGKA